MDKTSTDEPRAMKELDELFDELVALLKSGEACEALSATGVNVSLAMTAVHALRAYLHGEKEAAAEDFDTVAEEIHARIAASRELAIANAKDKPS